MGCLIIGSSYKICHYPKRYEIFSVCVSLVWGLCPVIWLSLCKAHSWEVHTIQHWFPFLIHVTLILYVFFFLNLFLPLQKRIILNSHWELFKMAQFFLAHNKGAASFYQNPDIMTQVHQKVYKLICLFWKIRINCHTSSLIL